MFDPADPQLLTELKHRIEEPVIVLVDDLDLIVGSPADSTLTEALTTGRELFVVAASAAEDLHSTFRGTSVPLRRNRCGVLLRPGPLDGELLGVSTGPGSQLCRATESPPGRGLLVVRGRTTPIQVAVSAQPMCGYR